MPSRRRNKSRDFEDVDIIRSGGGSGGNGGNLASLVANGAPAAAASSSTSSSSSRSRAAATAAAAPERPLCRFFVLHGNCRYGEGCAYSHELPDGGIVEARAHIPCPFFKRGCCKYGEHCQLRHGEVELGLGLGGKKTNSGTRSGGKSGDRKHEAEEETTLTCGICLEKVADTGRKYGLLSCPHVFCFECLMEWRKEGSREAEDRRACPTCRKHSNYIVPSDEFCLGEKKEQVVADYKARLAFIPCKKFDGTLGSCLFGRDCFYAHLGEDGEDMKPRDKTMRELHEARMRRRRRHDREELDIINNFLLLLDIYASGGALSGIERLRQSQIFGDLWEDDSDSDDYDDVD